MKMPVGDEPTGEATQSTRPWRSALEGLISGWSCAHWRSSVRSGLAVTAALVMFAGACGDDDDDATTTDSTAPSTDGGAAVPDTTGGAATATTASSGTEAAPSSVSTTIVEGHGTMPMPDASAPASGTATTVALDPEQQAAADAYRTVISSTGPVDAKLALIENGQQVRSTLDAYLAAAKTVNGIDVAVTDVQITGADAALTYDLLMAGTSPYPSMEGRATKVDGQWIVPRDEFCGVVSHVPGVSCPS